MDVKLISLLILFTLNELNIHSKLEKNMEKEHYYCEYCSKLFLFIPN